MSDNGDPDISRVFTQKVDRRFQRDFGRLLHHQPQQQQRPTTSENEQQRSRKTEHMKLVADVKLIEAKEEIERLKRQLNLRNEEIGRLKESETAAKEKAGDLQQQFSELKTEFERSKRTNRSFNENKQQEQLLLADYRTALSKYKTWVQFAEKQMHVMKTALEELGGWNEANRYKIYFAYREIQPQMVLDEQVPELANGSIIDYPGSIENIEGITASDVRPKFHTAFTQTEESAGGQNPPLSASSQAQSISSLNQSFTEAPGPGSRCGGEQMSVMELRLLDCEQQIDRLEFQNAKLREQLIILGDRAKHVELLEVQKEDLDMQIAILRRQNDQLIQEHEKLKTAFGGGAITRNSLEELVRNAEHMKLRNNELEQKLTQLQAQSEGGSVAESRRIAQIFKQKYEREMAELKARLNKYEPMHASDTTRILRFAQHNPLDEAHDEHMVKQVAAAAATSAGGGNPLKRRKMDDFGETSALGSDLTFLAEEEEEPDATALRELRLQLANVKQQQEQNEKNHGDYLAQYRELVTQLSGYDIRLGDDGFCEAENVHSRDCTFLFQKHPKPEEGEGPGAVDLLDNECAGRWRDVLENYLVRYQSIPAFLSAVTISLVESPETPSQRSESCSIVEENATESHGEEE